MHLLLGFLAEWKIDLDMGFVRMNKTFVTPPTPPAKLMPWASSTHESHRQLEPIR